MPLHPFCRCVTVAYFDDMDESTRTRAAIDPETGEPVKVKQSVKWSEWKDGSSRQLNSAENNSIIMTDTKETGSVGVRYVRKIDREIYKCVTPNITTDEVIITDERIDHCNKHLHAFDKYSSYIQTILEDPDVIYPDKNPNTGLLVRKIDSEGKYLQLVLRLHTTNDDPKYLNSILSLWDINEQRSKNYENNRKALYKREWKEYNKGASEGV